LVTFDLAELNDVETGMYFDSSIPQGYGVGSSGSSSSYDRYAQDKITVLENLTREKLLQLKIYSLKWKAFSRKSSGLDPLNSYLSIPILINSKIMKLQVFQIKLWTERRCVLLDSGIVGETLWSLSSWKT
jgi:mevalonate kinase